MRPTDRAHLIDLDQIPSGTLIPESFFHRGHHTPVNNISIKRSITTHSVEIYSAANHIKHFTFSINGVERHETLSILSFDSYGIISVTLPNPVIYADSENQRDFFSARSFLYRTGVTHPEQPNALAIPSYGTLQFPPSYRLTVSCVIQNPHNINGHPSFTVACGFTNGALLAGFFSDRSRTIAAPREIMPSFLDDDTSTTYRDDELTEEGRWNGGDLTS